MNARIQAFVVTLFACWLPLIVDLIRGKEGMELMASLIWGGCASLALGMITKVMTRKHHRG